MVSTPRNFSDLRANTQEEGTVMATPTTDWPKPWVLSIHEAAVNNGFVWVSPISEADADSLRQRAYRMRRRSDKAMAAYILPEYHLVMIGRWEPGPDGRGRLPFIYNKRSDGEPLPDIQCAEPEEVEAFEHPPTPTPPAISVTAEDITFKPGEIDNLVERMRRSARDRQKGDT
jgi:hypothetical protein